MTLKRRKDNCKLKEEALGPLCEELALEKSAICLKTDYEFNE
jgi:hypothetical protein